jgi:hypothetical protein
LGRPDALISADLITRGGGIEGKSRDALPTDTEEPASLGTDSLARLTGGTGDGSGDVRLRAISAEGNDVLNPGIQWH